MWMTPTVEILPPCPIVWKTQLLPPLLPHTSKTLGILWWLQNKPWNLPQKTFYVYFMHSSYIEPNNELLSLSFKDNFSFSRFITLFCNITSMNNKYWWPFQSCFSTVNWIIISISIYTFSFFIHQNCIIWLPRPKKQT